MNAVFAAFFFANSAGAFVVSTRKRGKRQSRRFWVNTKGCGIG